MLRESGYCQRFILLINQSVIIHRTITYTLNILICPQSTCSIIHHTSTSAALSLPELLIVQLRIFVSSGPRFKCFFFSYLLPAVPKWPKRPGSLASLILELRSPELEEREEPKVRYTNR
jgi:hypothetical protein